MEHKQSTNSLLGLPSESLKVVKVVNQNGNLLLPTPEINQFVGLGSRSELVNSSDETKDREIDNNVQVDQNNPDSSLQSQESEQGKASDSELIDESKVSQTEEILGVYPLTGQKLSKRLAVTPTVISSYRNGKYKKSLSEWSQSRDPEGVAWEFSEELKKYIPIQNLPTSSTNSLQTELLDECQNGTAQLQMEQKSLDEISLTGEQLATRLGLANKRSLDNRRVGQQAETFPKWSQKKDPDGIAWHYIQELRIYTPIELSSEPEVSLLDFELSSSNTQVDDNYREKLAKTQGGN